MNKLADNCLIISLSILILVIISIFVLIFKAEEKIKATHEQHRKSIQLSGALRQSSDDLTRMVRTYIVTKRPRYKEHFNEILAIRDGDSPRPTQLNSIYWDLVLENNDRPTPFGGEASLLDLMKRAGFTAEELKLLEKAKASSDKLAAIEKNAMSLVENEAIHVDTHMKAIASLHDEQYHRYKAGIMSPIAEFQALVERRTLKDINTSESYLSILIALLILALFLVAYLLIRLFVYQHSESEKLADTLALIQALKQREKENIYLATVHSTQHILNNLLNQLTWIKMKLNKSPSMDEKVMHEFDQITLEASDLLKRLSSVEEIEEQSIKDSVSPRK